MLEFFSKLLSNDFMPHRMCFLDNSAVLWLNVISDSLIAVAYYLIPLLLFRFTGKRRDIAFNWIFVAFGVFILACGTSHLLGAVTVFNAVYRLEGVVKATTAIASMATFILLARMMPTLVALPSPSELAAVNRKLAAQIDERRAAEAEVRRVNTELEERVASRTSSLEHAMGELRQEMDRRRDLEGQLIQAQKMEAIGRLAGGVAHDFNNLLSVILGYGEMLRERNAADPEALEFAEEVLRAGERAAALTKQLLAFSRRQLAVPRILDLNNIVRQMEKMLRRIIGEDLTLEMRLSPSLSPVKIDPSHIDQVIINLAVNSRDAMPDGGTLVIETANVELTAEYAATHLGIAPGQYVMLAVSDTGTGMDAATRARIFEPFFTTKEKGKGTGLGLSIVYGIVKQDGGEIMVYSEPGMGTAFKIYLPAVKEAAEPLPAAMPEILQAPLTATILLVEDEEQVRHLTRTILQTQGYRVLEAASPGRALELLRETSEPVDLLLSDIVLPERNGLDLAREVRAMRPGIKLLFMSGYTDAAVLNQGLTPDTPFIQKPFTAAGLRQKLAEVLR
jgi:two-component system cell cycle sensor histidine kinase/response regulator CckA